MPTGAKLVRKNAYLAKLQDLVQNTPIALIVNVNNVGSKQLQEVRLALRGECQILMGKNTMIRKALRDKIDALLKEDENADTSAWTNLLSAVNGNIGFIFCLNGQDSLNLAREVMAKNVVPAAAKAGVIAQSNVTFPAGPTGLDPSSTSFFQTLNIATKIVKGNIEILTATQVCTKGEKVTLSAQALLTKMNIRPFEYGINLVSVYQEGNVFDSAVLDITDDILIKKFLTGVNHVAAFGREVGIPTEAGLKHMMTRCFKNIVSVCVSCDVSGGEKVDEIKAILSDPEKMAAMKAAGAATGAAPAAGGAAAAPAAAAAEEEEEEEMDFDLFG